MLVFTYLLPEFVSGGVLAPAQPASRSDGWKANGFLQIYDTDFQMWKGLFPETYVNGRVFNVR